MTERSAAHASWQHAAIVILASEAVAVAIWLLPASIHIVKWPSSGPVRLALLAPAWQLATLGAGALVVSLAFLAWARAGGLEGQGRHCRLAGRGGQTVAPFLLLWLWVVPYLPWLPDRLPLLLVLAGPLRWTVAAAALVSVLLSTTNLRRQLARLLSLGRGTVFIVSLGIYLGLGIYSAQTIGVVGDEPHYMVITESLLKDGDLKIENNHQRRDYLSFYPGELRPDFFQRGLNGEIYSIHAPGLPALILPAYAVAGRLGAVGLIALIAALTALAIFDLALAIADRSTAVLTWAACCLTVPFLPHAWLMFPEVPGALLVAWAALWLWKEADSGAITWAWRGLALSALPWLHTKFVVFLVIFAAALALRLWKRRHHLIAFLVPVAITGALWLYSFYVIYGSLNPEAPYGDYTRAYVLTRNIPHGLLGMFFDQKFGLLLYSPIYLAAIAGAWLILRRTDTRFLGAVLVVAIGAFVGSTARLYMFWGGSSAPARFLVPVLPCLAPLMALAFAQARSAMARALVGLWLAISLAAAALGVARPDRLMLFSDPHGGGARVLEAIQSASPLADVLPAFTNPDWTSHIGQLAAWLVAALVALGAMTLMSRLGRSTGPWRLAGIACATFLIAGALFTPRPSAQARETTALRGDLDVLWRFDGNRFRTLDYETLRRASADDLRELTTMVITPETSQIGDSGYTSGTLSLPPGTFETRVWFANAVAGEGEVVVAASPRVTFGRTAGPLPNPATVPFDLPVAVRRLIVRVSDRSVAALVDRVVIAPLTVVPAGARDDITVRSIEPLDVRPGAYLVYADEHAYPEGGVFWSRGTAQTTVWVAPNGASRLVLTLSTGPMTGDVTLSAAGASRTVAMTAGELKVVSFDLPPGRRLVPVTIQSTVMFRPAEVDKRSTDMRGLGCQVRIGLE